MKIFYNNDENQIVTVRLIGPAPDCTNSYIPLKPQEGKVFEIPHAPPGSIPYVKRWDNRTILLSYIEPALIADIEKAYSSSDT